MILRLERDTDAPAIAQVDTRAFGRQAEAQLIDLLRAQSLVAISVVALTSGTVVGNAVFSKLALRAEKESLKGVALAPVAVLPQYQRRGIGTRMIEYGLRRCAARSFDVALVLGDPDYYARFGFSSDLAKNVESRYSKAGDAWMALELRPVQLETMHARVTYPAAFSVLD